MALVCSVKRWVKNKDNFEACAFVQNFVRLSMAILDLTIFQTM